MKSTIPNSQEFEAKDTARIMSMVRQAGVMPNGVIADSARLHRLARAMARSITKADKALRRGRAAENENLHSVAEVFFNRATELGTPAGALKAATEARGGGGLPFPEPTVVIEVKNVVFREKEKFSAKPRVYFHDETPNADAAERFMSRYTPREVFTPHLDTVLRPLGMTLANTGTDRKHRLQVKVRWSQHAGCSCPCSPGFIVDNSEYEFDIHVHYVVTSGRAKARHRA